MVGSGHTTQARHLSALLPFVVVAVVVVVVDDDKKNGYVFDVPFGLLVLLYEYTYIWGEKFFSLILRT